MRKTISLLCLAAVCVWMAESSPASADKGVRLFLYCGSTVRLQSFKGDYLHRPDGTQGVTTSRAGAGNVWALQCQGDLLKLRSFKGDYLHPASTGQGVTMRPLGGDYAWTVERSGDKVKLRSFKGDYLHRPDTEQGVTTSSTGAGNEWNLEVAMCGAAACWLPVPGLGAAGTKPADLVLMGDGIYTMDRVRPRGSAVAVDDGRIVHVGTRASVHPFIGADTRLEELGRGALLPGLHDSHNHLVWSGTELQDVVQASATTVAELRALIAAHAARSPGEPWLRGSGWENSVFEGKLHRSQLDEIVPDRPVYMVGADGHTAWVNSAALAEAGITAATPDPAGGRIDRDASGQPTGILRETAALLVSNRMPPYSQTQIDKGLTEALALANSYGLTSIIDPAVKPWMLDGYQRFADRGALTVRVHAAVGIEPGQGAKQLDAIETLRARYRSPMVQVNAVKLYIDGVIESKTAYMLKPYTDGSNGKPNFTDQELSDILIAADRAGFQTHAHVVGDGAVRQVLDALARVQATNGVRDRRPILAHLQVLDPADLPRFGALAVHAAFSPLWATPGTPIDELTVPVIGPERSRWIYPIAAVQRAGGVLLGSSDWSVSSMDPFEAMEAGITRQDTEKDGGPMLTPAQRVTLQQMLEAYTINGARASFVERELGSITVGKRADLVVIDRDPYVVSPHELSEIQVVMTLLDGREVYRARN